MNAWHSHGCISLMVAVCCVAVLALVGCAKNSETMQATDQCMRNEIFERCLARVPPGPVGTKYNDWDEVVGSCENTAYYQSQRPAKFVKPECRQSL